MNTALKQSGYWLAVGSTNPLHQQLTLHKRQAYQRFCRSWEHLVRDPYLRDGGHYRYRRYAVLQWQHHKLRVLAHEPHYQSNHHNPIHGGFYRHFRAWQPTTLRNPVLTTIVRWATQQFCANPATVWRIQAHQFRILADAQQYGKPTPEGIHKDGAEYILIMLIHRHNVTGGVSRVYDNAKRLLQATTLQAMGDLVLVNDHAVYHDVSVINPIAGDDPAWRDVLVLTFHRQAH